MFDMKITLATHIDDPAAGEAGDVINRPCFHDALDKLGVGDVPGLGFSDGGDYFLSGKFLGGDRMRKGNAFNMTLTGCRVVAILGKHEVHVVGFHAVVQEPADHFGEFECVVQGTLDDFFNDAGIHMDLLLFNGSIGQAVGPGQLL
jgi:hypothetical protein